MPRKPEQGEPAKYNFQPVGYSHFDVHPAASLVLTADPWSYAYAWLTKRAQKSRGEKRRRLDRAIYFLDLAENFYTAAESVELPTQATLVYYGFLNLAKCYISAEGVELETGPEIHGLMLSRDEGSSVVVASRPKSSVSIFHELARCLGTPVSAKAEIPLADVCSQIPEIHEIGFTLGQLPKQRRHLVSVVIDFLVNVDHDKLFTEIRYEKKSEARLPDLENRFYQGSRRAYFHQIEGRVGWITYRSERRALSSPASWKRVYKNIVNEYRRFDVWSLLTRGGYRYYCNLSKPPYHQHLYVMMLMFYLGTAARYRPTEMKELLDSELGTLVAEAIAICPKQFLYQMVGLTTRSVCVLPHAMLE